MDSSNIHEGIEECSSSESGWTMYIASPDDDEHDEHVDNEYDEDASFGGQGCKKDDDDDDDDVDSDDSMASDASSGPSDQRQHLRGQRGFRHAGRGDEGKYADEKDYSNQPEDKKKHHEQKKVKAVTDKSAGHKANTAGRSKKI